MSPSRPRLTAALVAATLVASASCSAGDAARPATTEPATATSGDSAEVASPPDAPSEVGQLRWDGPSERWGTLTVPLDHDDPDGPTVDVPLGRRHADDPERRIGVLLVNPGGPGDDALWMISEARFLFGEELLERFDIVALSPRGTFEATAVDCWSGDDWARGVTSADWSPDDDGEAEALDRLIDEILAGCVERHGEMLEHVSTTDTVGDLALLVEALGEDEVSYLGFSYGTVLGAAFATAHPELVRAAVLDAAYHPVGDPLETALVQARAVDARLVRIYDDCDADPACPIRGGARGAFERVAAAVVAADRRTDPDLPPVTERSLAETLLWREDAYTGQPPRSLLAAVASADGGDWTPLQREFLSVVELWSGYGANTPISCLDWPHRGGAVVPPGLQERYAAEAPSLHALFPTVTVERVCERWPIDPEPLPTPLSAAGAGPILVLTATGDPVTPPGGARLLADELRGAALVEVAAAEHVSYGGGEPAQRCASDHVHRLLLDLELPPDGTVCASGG